MRMRTATTRRSIDKWREKARTEATRFYASTAVMAAFILSTPRRGKFFLVLPMVFALALNFAVLELVVLILIGFLFAKLHCYRFVNSALRFMTLTRT
jgi:hypothetical protein